MALTLGYFALMFLISYFSSRKTDNAGFFVGNRKNPWYIVAIATLGAGMSGVTFVSVPGMVAASGFAYLQMCLGFIVGQAVIAFVLLPLYYRLNLYSIYGYLENRFGLTTYRTGAWFFFISKMLGASVRIFLVSLTMQLLVFDPLGLPFILNVLMTVLLVWVYTFFGGVKSVIRTDLLKSIALVTSVVLCLVFIARALHLNLAGLVQTVSESNMSRIFFFDDVNDRRYFWKQFLAGAFTLIAMNGLDQDMMQRNLSCKSSGESTKNMLVSIVVQFFIIALFLALGVVLYLFAQKEGITLPQNPDQVFPFLATSGVLPLAVGVFFIIGLVAASYSAAGSALTALTTSFTLDILRAGNKEERKLTRTRRGVHIAMAAVMGLCILFFEIFNSTSVIDTVYILSSYTYGPLLGMFAFGIFVHKKVRDKWVPLPALLAPVLCFILDKNSTEWFGGYHFSYELLMLNALFTFLGLLLLIKPTPQAK